LDNDILDENHDLDSRTNEKIRLRRIVKM